MTTTSTFPCYRDHPKFWDETLIIQIIYTIMLIHQHTKYISYIISRIIFLQAEINSSERKLFGKKPVSTIPIMYLH